MISVIVPIYNAECFLEKCISSLLAQSYRDFEILLLDDGSTDGSADICDALCEEHSCIRVVHTENRGVAAARNLGIALALGDCICFVDADDRVPNSYLEVLFGCLGNADISVCDIAIYRGGNESARFTCNEPLLENTEAISRLLSRKEINTGPCGKLFKSAIIKELRFPDLKIYEDILFVLEAFDKARKIAFTSNTEYSYMQNYDSAMNTLNAVKCLDAVKAADIICSYICENGNLFLGLPFYTTVSHMFQYFIREPKTEEEICLDRAIIEVLAKYRSSIRACGAFSFKEKLIYLAASRNIRIKNGFGKLI